MSATLNHLAECDGIVTMSKARKEAARQAAAEIEGLCLALRDSINNSECPDLLVRGMTARIKSMACVVMSAVDDEAEDVGKLYSRLGIPLPN